MKKVSMIVFDMAGTTVNENNLVYKTIHKAIGEAGFTVSLEEVLQHGAGKEKHRAITDILTASSKRTGIATVTDEIGITTDTIASAADEIFANFKQLLKTAYEDAAVSSFPGVEDFLRQAKQAGIITVLNTGYDSKTANGLLQKLGWEIGNHFDELVTADDVSNGRPAPDMIFRAMEIFHLKDASQVVKVGDSDVDILEGKNAGCGLSIGVLSGAQNTEQMQSAKPDYILDSVADLGSVIDLS